VDGRNRSSRLFAIASPTNWVQDVVSDEQKFGADHSWLPAALDAANLPTLACLLVLLTGDRKWIEGVYAPTRTRGLDDNDDGGLSPEIQVEIRTAAAVALADWLNGKLLAIANPSDHLLLEMMGVSLGEVIPAEYAPMIRSELQLPLGNDAKGRTAALRGFPPDFNVLIVGAGISGLCAAIYLDRARIPYKILERSKRLGGVWFENRYPGAACDVPSHLYSFSFAPFQWSRYFADSVEINGYLEKVAEDFDVRRHIRFGREVCELIYDEAGAAWEATVRSAAGEIETLRAKAVISCVGAFNKPRIPALPGLSRFKGPSVHTARYPRDGLDLSDRDVVLVGNGASAMQVAPAIADDVKSLTIIQRTPQWVAPFPKFKQAIPEPLKRLLAEVPMYRLWYRLRLSWAFNDKLYGSLQKDPAWKGDGRSINAINDGHRRGLSHYIEQELGNARHLLPKVLPDYPPFGKRMLLDNGWFRTLGRDHVHHVAGEVVNVTEDAVITSGGERHPADVLIWATGFDVVNLLAPMKVRGIGGQDLHEMWHGDDAKAYLGTVVPGFPNFFCLYGPNTQFGHGGSLISVLERQMHYVMSLFDQMAESDLVAVEVREDVHDAYNDKVDKAHSRMIWTAPGVDGYYRSSRGRIVVNNPFRIIDVWKMTERANLDDYHIVEKRVRSADKAVRCNGVEL
jgi:4-hydroxyacetophenone monooxygenase